MDSRKPPHQSADEGDCRSQRADNSQNRSRKPGRKQEKALEISSCAELIPLTINHFFPDFNQSLAELPDCRDQQMCTYSKEHLFYLGLFMFLFHCGSRNQLRRESQTDAFQKNLLTMSGSDEDFVATPDTMNYYFKNLDSVHLQKIPCQMVKQLLKKRVLEDYRFNGAYKIAIDAVKIYTFHERHCPHCTYTTQKDTGVKTYFHYVLEAKLIAGEFAFSIASEFIENPEKFDKQDCELKGAYRLIPKIKKLFPRLDIVLLLDGLYLNQNIIALCDEYNWSYMITFKAGSAKELQERVDIEYELHPEKTAFRESDGISQKCSWVNNIDFKAHTIHVMKSEGVEDGVEKYFAHATDIRPTKNNIFELVNQGARQRWKIENQGFNIQKNHGFELDHPYGLQGFAWKNFYIIMQIAHLIEQLVLYSDLFRKLQIHNHILHGKSAKEARRLAEKCVLSLRAFCVTRKNTARRLLESVRCHVFDPAILALSQSIQIRFNSS